MRIKRSLISVTVIVAMLFSTVISSAEQISSQTDSKTLSVQDSKTDRFIVKYKTEKTADNLLSKSGNKIKSLKKLKNKKFDVITTNSKIDKAELLSQLNDDNIEYIVPDNQVQLSSDDTYFDKQWAINNTPSVQADVYASEPNNIDIGVVSAWSQSQGEGTVVAVADTGIDITHEDLAENIWVNKDEIPSNGIDDDGNGYIDDVNGWNFYDDNNQVHSEANVTDEAHGTHIAGIIVAVKDNQKGISGVAPKAKVMPLKIFNNGSAYTSDIIEAIDYAEKMGVKIFNASWGTTIENQALKEAIESKSNMLFVCAVGNSGVNIDVNPVYPACYTSSNIITVASIDKSGSLASTSNYGENSVDVAAPGEEIFSSLPENDYGYKSGTSMAAPFVAGQAALIFSKYDEVTPGQVKGKIIDSSDSIERFAEKICSGNKINCGNSIIGPIGEEINQNVSVVESVYQSVYQNNDGFSLYSTSCYPNVIGGSTQIGMFATPEAAVNADVIDTQFPATGAMVKAARLKTGSGLELIQTSPLNLKTNTDYVLEFDSWSDADNMSFIVDLYPDTLPETYPKTGRAVNHFKWIVNSGSMDMKSARIRLFAGNLTANVYITNIQMYEVIHSASNLVNGSNEIGMFATTTDKRGVSIVDKVHPTQGTVKAVRLDAGASIPCIGTQPLNLKTNTPYVVEFDYWADMDNIQFDVDLWPDDLPQYLPKAMKTMKHFKAEFSSASPNMYKASLRIFNDTVSTNSTNIYITNIQLYETIHSINNKVRENTAIGVFETTTDKRGVSIVDAVHPTQGTVKAVRLDAGASIPCIGTQPLNLKTNTPYVVEFDYWADMDNIQFDVDLWPDDLPQYYPKAMRKLQHFKVEFSLASTNMEKASLRFFNDLVATNPSNIYITNIQLYGTIHSIKNKVDGTNEVGVFETTTDKRGVSIVDAVHPTQGTVKAVRLDAGASMPCIGTQPLNLKANTSYVVEFDYWADIDNIQFDVDLWPDDLPQYYPKAMKTLQHFKVEFSSASTNMEKASLRFFNDLVATNPSNIYITNIQIYETNYSTDKWGSSALIYLYDNNNRLVYITKNGGTLLSFTYDNNGNLISKQVVQ